jgi:pimeloyl-ACP methyl ester carboxylesterase
MTAEGERIDPARKDPPSSGELRDTDSPILFVHGNGGFAAQWQTTIWRFESNGYDPGALFALDIPHPTAPSEDSKPERNRSTTQEQKAFLGGSVDRILEASGATKLVLVGSSRGGNAIRSYVRFGNGFEKVSLAILCGAPNHGAYALGQNLDNEFNGRGHFVESLNEGGEVHPDVRFVTLRSDRHDHYAQPTFPLPGSALEGTGAGYHGPGLEGAENIVLPGLDHREVAFHEDAFREIFRAVTGKRPQRTDIQPEARPVIEGRVSGYENGAPTNLPLVNARVTIYEVEAESGTRRGAPRHEILTEADGRWGPFEASPSASYEMVASAAGYPTFHFYRSPFPRSTRSLSLRLEPLNAILGGNATEKGESVVVMTRPRGYFGHGRDRFTLAGRVPEGVSPGVPRTSVALGSFDAGLSVSAVLNSETIVARTFPLNEGHLSIVEFHY